MIVLGLTGSIGMGKSTTASLFGECGAAVYDADAAVHALYQRGGAAVEPIEAAFPGVVIDGAVDRTRLRERVVDDPEKFAALNAIVHPLVAMANRDFRQTAEAAGHQIAVLDIPLLFETGGQAACDYVCVVTAKAETQRLRVLARPGMTEAALQEILSRQMPDAEKRAKADFIVFTEYGLDFARAEVRAIMDVLIRLNLLRS